MTENGRFPRPVNFVQQMDEFSDTEVGITHPFLSSHVRLKDNGDIELVAAEGLAIVMRPSNRSITFVADDIKFLTRPSGGLRWNKLRFNERANEYQEPTFIDVSDQDEFSLYSGVESFLYDDEDDTAPAPPAIEVLDPETGVKISYTQYYNKYGRTPPFGSST